MFLYKMLQNMMITNSWTGAKLGVLSENFSSNTLVPWPIQYYIRNIKEPAVRKVGIWIFQKIENQGSIPRPV
jgi:hypothetical protein